MIYCPRFKINQGIDIGGCIGFTPDNRTGKAGLAGVVPGGKTEGVGPVANNQVSLCHRNIV
jgi:hypothetical protein